MFIYLVCGCVYTMTHKWKSEHTFKNWCLFFHHACPGDHTELDFKTISCILYDSRIKVEISD